MGAKWSGIKIVVTNVNVKKLEVDLRWVYRFCGIMYKLKWICTNLKE